MTLSNHSGEDSFTIGDNSFTNRATSGTPIYERSGGTGGGSGGGSGGGDSWVSVTASEGEFIDDLTPVTPEWMDIDVSSIVGTEDTLALTYWTATQADNYRTIEIRRTGDSHPATGYGGAAPTLAGSGATSAQLSHGGGAYLLAPITAGHFEARSPWQSGYTGTIVGYFKPNSSSGGSTGGSGGLGIEFFDTVEILTDDLTAGNWASATGDWVTVPSDSAWAGADNIIISVGLFDGDTAGNTGQAFEVRANSNSTSVEVLRHHGTSNDRSATVVQAIIPINSDGTWQYRHAVMYGSYARINHLRASGKVSASTGSGSTGTGSGGSSSVSISMGSMFPIHGDAVAALVIDQTIFIAEGDQSGLSNLQLGQFTFPDLVLEDLIIPIKDPIAGKTNPNSPGGWDQSDEWINDTITLTADWFGSDGSTIDIYVGHGSSIRFSKFTYNRSTRTCSPIEYLGKEKHGHDSDADAIVGVHGSDLYTTRVQTDGTGKRRRVRTIGFEPESQKTTNGIGWTEYRRKFTGSGNQSDDKYYLPELTPGPFGLVEGVEWTDTYYDNTYMSVAGINPWTGRMYFKVDGFCNGLEVWQIDPGHKPDDGNYVGALSTIVDSSYGSKTGKLSYIKNTKLPVAAVCTLDAARNRLDISFDVDTQKPLWVFAPGYSGDRAAKFGSLTPWNPAWT